MYPSSDLPIELSCLVDEAPNTNGAHVCYVQQLGGYAPMSMTCSVGNCLY